MIKYTMKALLKNRIKNIFEGRIMGGNFRRLCSHIEYKVISETLSNTLNYLMITKELWSV